MPFDVLREQMLRAGIAPRRVRRYLRELDNHLSDLTEQEIATGHGAAQAASRARALLGSDAALAEAWLREPKLKSFTARAPWLVFVVMPPLVTLFVLMVFVVLLAAIMHKYGMMLRPHMVVAPKPGPQWVREMIGFITWAANLLIDPVIALLIVAIAWRQRLSPAWPVIGTLVILLFALQLSSNSPAVPIRYGFVGMEWRYSGGSVNAGLGPLFSTAARAWMAQNWLRLGMQYALTALPVAWLAWTRWRGKVMESRI